MSPSAQPNALRVEAYLNAAAATAVISDNPLDERTLRRSLRKTDPVRFGLAADEVLHVAPTPEDVIDLRRRVSERLGH